jgi:hypothetical protein
MREWAMTEKAITTTLKALKEETDGARVTVGEVLDVLNNRGFGSLLLVLSILMILPTGAIPGFPAVCALLICLVTVQILAGRHAPWMPERVRNFSFSRKRLVKTIEKAMPYLRAAERYICPRCDFIFSKFLKYIVAVFCLGLAILMFFTGFIPFIPALLSIPILFFAVGIAAKDGLMIIVGFSFTVAVVIVVLWLSGVMGGEERIQIGKPVFIKQPDFIMSFE